jgi:hypothetical protein
MKLGFHGLEIVEFHGWTSLFIGVVGSHCSAQVAEAVSISNQRLVLLFVRIQRVLVKNTVGEISFIEADSQPETTTPIRAGHRWASRKLAGWAMPQLY